jgi:hypothetical protein
MNIQPSLSSDFQYPLIILFIVHIEERMEQGLNDVIYLTYLPTLGCIILLVFNTFTKGTGFKEKRTMTYYKVLNDGKGPPRMCFSPS